ncbi:MAG: alpha-glucan family phosphorylase, partial [Phycisphaerae bacterium]|nr:alpha-glucan family phosphorylase [Phycisphaerae bacterium]
AAFMALERIRIFREAASLSFDEALQATKAGNVFTIHTPVKAGNDEFPPEMIEKYFKNYIPTLGITQEQFLSLGRLKFDDDEEAFKMPVLALRLSSFRNGVSRLHGEVSRKMWSGLWSNIPMCEVPITSITNGIHAQTWLSREISGLYDRYLGPNWTIGEQESNTWDNIDNIPDEEFWRAHQRCKEQLVGFARGRLKAQVQRRGTYHSELNWAEEVLDPEALTIGFARRFATYKRGNLMMSDPERLVRILTNKERPIQLIFAGKAHPRDTEGKEIIRSIIHFASKFNVRRRIIFLEDYDMDVARYLVQGVDVWLNNPRPPMEASGTSGMKAAMNGVLNLSTYDGWWCEGYQPQAGWIIGSGEQYDDNTYQDTIESQAIYNLLENEIVPLFYTRATDNLPRAWIHRVKKSIQWIAPRFNTHRMLAEYTRRFYSPALDKAEDLTADAMSKAKALAKWQAQLSKAWKDFSIKDVMVNVNGYTSNDSLIQIKVGTELHIRALVLLGRISPDDVSVELFHGSIDAWGNIKDGSAVAMQNSETATESGEYSFECDIRCKSSGRQGIAVRILPKNDNLVNPYEPGLILWENS